MSIIYDALKKAEDKYKGGSIPQVKVKKNSLVLPILFVGAILLIVAIALPSKKKASSVIQKAPSPIVAEMVSPATLTNVTKKEETIAEESIPVDYILEGIVYDAELPTAIINGRILKIKDKIDNLEVKNITPDSVELINLKDNTTLKLTLKNISN